MAQVKRGGRQDYLCDGCKELIAKGTPHARKGNSPNFKRYHEGCASNPDPVTEAPADTETSTNPGPIRDAQGRFIKVQ